MKLPKQTIITAFYCLDEKKVLLFLTKPINYVSSRYLSWFVVAWLSLSVMRLSLLIMDIQGPASGLCSAVVSAVKA